MTRIVWIGWSTILKHILTITLILSHGTLVLAQDPFETNTAVGLFADPEGSSSCISVAPGEFGTIYIVATTGGQSASGFAGAEFRIEITNPEGYIFTYEGPPAANVVLGNALDLTTDGSTDPAGLNLAFPECQTMTGNAGDRLSLGTIQVFNLSGGPTELKIKKRSPPLNRMLRWPEFNLCDGPYFTATPMQVCSAEPTAELIAGRARLNDPGCNTESLCTSDCSDPPRLQLIARKTPELGCIGETVLYEGIAHNTGASSASITMLVDGVEESTSEVAPGDSVVVTRTLLVEECTSPLTGHTFGAVARTASCELPTGREVRVEAHCSVGQCDDGTEGCAAVYLDSRWRVMAGQTFSVDVHVGYGEHRARDLFGMTARLHFGRPDLVEFVEFVCVDENGAPLSLGEDVICFSSADQNAGYVDFAVSQKGYASGKYGSLQIGRAVFRFPEELGGGFCTQFLLDEVRLMGSGGGSLCFENWRDGTSICSTSPCQVWPGDANRDGVVDELDLETIAAFWGEEGPHRTLYEEGCSWGGSYAHPKEVDCWSTYDAAWSDTYGDGRVGVEDVLCVGLHWGNMHETDESTVQVPNRSVLQRKQTYEQMLAYMNGMSDNSDGVAEARQALSQMIASIQIPAATVLHQNAPNPFNPWTEISFEITQAGFVQIDVYDVMGRLVATLEKGPREVGVHSTIWDGTRETGEGAASGIYYYRAQLGEKTFSRKMVLAR